MKKQDTRLSAAEIGRGDDEGPSAKVRSASIRGLYPGVRGLFLEGANGRSRRSRMLAVGDEPNGDEVADELPFEASALSHSSAEEDDAFEGLEPLEKVCKKSRSSKTYAEQFSDM